MVGRWTGWRSLPLFGGRRCGRGDFLNPSQITHFLHELRMGFDFPIQLQGKDFGDDAIKLRAGLNPEGLQFRSWQLGTYLRGLEQRSS